MSEPHVVTNSDQRPKPSASYRWGIAVPLSNQTWTVLAWFKTRKAAYLSARATRGAFAIARIEEL